ncbi:hypothetical protein B0T14DRAFT_565689 [Immersiella caudata]|uniref:Initiation-specific alpha-1,6-mannosyltransferase n=1 Tax=Immersiella caudata TaxID=314043 RepID=A0AA39WZD9_9PEZI|nr:hypothetical protein B0T14DRAFT_565689 [Immersiella caudata]
MSPIPAKIWQILLPERPEQDTRLPNPAGPGEAQSWTSLNPNHTYTLLDQHNASAFVRSHFSHTNPDLVKLYLALPDVRMKSDLLRYLVLDIEGGVYSDLDTVALKPISDWIPPSMHNATKLVVGIVASSRDGARWANTTQPAQFCQWMIAAAPGHPAFRKMIERVQKSMAELSESYRLPVVELNPTRDEIMNSTGSAAWTEVVLEVLQGYGEALKSRKDLALLTEPRLIGDILVLPPDALSLGLDHSNTTSHASRPEAALVEHLSPGTRRT